MAAMAGESRDGSCRSLEIRGCLFRFLRAKQRGRNASSCEIALAPSQTMTNSDAASRSGNMRCSMNAEQQEGTRRASQGAHGMIIERQ